ncbi:MAG: hypothetical protein ACLUVB_05510 [Acutalibacteraceae bacterium]
MTKEVDAENLRCKRLYLSAQGSACARSAARRSADRKAFASFSRRAARTAQMLDRITINLTGEAENIVNGETFGSLHRQLESMDRVEKKG